MPISTCKLRMKTCLPAWCNGYLVGTLVLCPTEAVFCQRAIESAEQDEQNIMQRFVDDQAQLGSSRETTHLPKADLLTSWFPLFGPVKVPGAPFISRSFGGR